MKYVRTQHWASTSPGDGPTGLTITWFVTTGGTTGVTTGVTTGGTTGVTTGVTTGGTTGGTTGVTTGVGILTFTSALKFIYFNCNF